MPRFSKHTFTRILKTAVWDGVRSGLLFVALATLLQHAHAQSRPPAALDTYDASDRAATLFNGARAEYAALNPLSRQLPKYKIPLDPPTVDRNSRAEVLAMYHGSFGMQSKWAPYWNGSTATCDYGTTKRSYQEAMAARTNWWRAFVGRPNSLSFKLDSLQTQRSQAGAVALQASARFTHEIDPSFQCYSSTAKLGAYSNLDGNPWTDAAAVDGYLDDGGASNFFAGHRYSLLSGDNRLLGAGSTGGAFEVLGQFGVNSRVSALGVRTTLGLLRPDPVIAWPPAGIVLHNLLPKWSKWSYASSEFKSAGSASVNITRNGVPFPVAITYRTGAEEFNDATVVWDMPDAAVAYLGTNTLDSDVVFHVVVSNLTGFDNAPHSVEYDVIAINGFPGYPNWSGDQTASAVHEFYWPDRDTYFVSVARSDAEVLDEISQDLYRTWRGFYAWDSAEKARAADPAAVPVCRWYFKAPANTHFYSAKASDCELLRATYAGRPDVAVEDSAAAFYVVPPSADGTCSTKYQPVRRMFNAQVGTGKPPNHRYTAHPGDVRAMVALGWQDEGIAFCAPRKKELYAGNPAQAWY